LQENKSHNDKILISGKGRRWGNCLFVSFWLTPNPTNCPAISGHLRWVTVRLNFTKWNFIQIRQSFLAMFAGISTYRQKANARLVAQTVSILKSMESQSLPRKIASKMNSAYIFSNSCSGVPMLQNYLFFWVSRSFSKISSIARPDFVPKMEMPIEAKSRSANAISMVLRGKFQAGILASSGI